MYIKSISVVIKWITTKQIGTAHQRPICLVVNPLIARDEFLQFSEAIKDTSWGRSIVGLMQSAVNRKSESSNLSVPVTKMKNKRCPCCNRKMFELKDGTHTHLFSLALDETLNDGTVVK